MPSAERVFKASANVKPMVQAFQLFAVLVRVSSTPCVFIGLNVDQIVQVIELRLPPSPPPLHTPVLSAALGGAIFFWFDPNLAVPIRLKENHFLGLKLLTFLVRPHSTNALQPSAAISAKGTTIPLNASWNSSAVFPEQSGRFRRSIGFGDSASEVNRSINDITYLKLSGLHI